MKLVKNLFIFLIFVAIAAFILSFLAPVEQKVQRSILINAKPAEVYRQMLLLQNFNNWSVWGKADSSIKYSHDGKDGVVGAKVSWEGSPVLSGKGEITLTELQQDKLIKHNVQLLEPRPLTAHSKFELIPVGNQTEVKWTFTVPSKRPLNIFNIFYSLDKERGADFSSGLTALKMMIEKSPLPDPAAIKVQPAHFPFTNYAGIRQTVLWVDYPTFFQQHFIHLNNYVLKGREAIKTGLFFDSNDELHQSIVATAYPLPVGFKPELNIPEEFIEIPASKALEVSFKGKEDVKQQAYKALDEYVAQHKLKLKMPVVEQYLSEDSLPQTKIIYLVE